jgi:signal transduction histidine kinase
VTATGAGAPRPPARLAIGTALAAGAATLAVVLVPFLGFVYRAPALRAVLETLNAVIALLVAFLIYGRLRQSRRLQDLLMVLALCTVAVANLALTALPSAVALARGEDFSRWQALAIRLLGTVVLAAAAVVPPRVTVRGRTTVMATAATVGLVVVLAVTGLLLGTALPPTVDPTVGLADSGSPRLVAHPVVLGVQAIGVALLAVAAVAFTRQSARTADPLLRWVGAGCVLAAAAGVHYVLFPSLYSDYVHTGDVLRLGFYLVLLVGAAAEIRSYWELRMQAAVLDERRRMARELHDGLTQELALIASQSRRLVARGGDAAIAERISAAAGRALDEARRAIAALVRPVDQPFAEALQHLADELADRYDVKIVTHLERGAHLDPLQSETLLRIVGEAVRNAVRHGAADRVEIRMDASPPCLSISDDGTGFDPDRLTVHGSGGFGLTSMRQRAESLDCELSVTSSPGEGAFVRVSLR